MSENSELNVKEMILTTPHKSEKTVDTDLEEEDEIPGDKSPVQQYSSDNSPRLLREAEAWLDTMEGLLTNRPDSPFESNQKS